MKKLVSLVLFVVMLAATVCASAMPLVTEPTTLTIAARLHGTHKSYDEMYMYNYYEELTGVDIEWDITPDASWQERKNLIFASGELPDILLRANMSIGEQLNYGAMQGMLVDLAPMLEEYAPNFSALLEEYPNVRDAITIDGAIYSLPQIIPMLFPRDNGFWINSQWLDKCGLEMPTTVDEFYNMLVAFKNCDFNGNGVADEYAISFRSSATSIYNTFNTFLGIFGMRTLGVNSGYFDVDETGALRFFPTCERYREMLKFLNKLWEEGLIDVDVFTHSNAQLTAKGDAGIYGVIAGLNNPAMASADADNMQYWYGMPVIENQWGEKKWGSIGSELNNQGTAVITTACENPELALQWLDYFYSDEGIKLVYWGVEGETYTVKEDGTFQYTDMVMESPNKSSDFLPRDSSQLPLIHDLELSYDLTMWAVKQQLKAEELHTPYIPERIWYPIFTTAEQSELNAMQTDINTYIEETRLQFLMGELDVEDDGEWQKYIDKLNTMNLARFYEIYNDCYTRTYGE